MQRETTPPTPPAPCTVHRPVSATGGLQSTGRARSVLLVWGGARGLHPLCGPPSVYSVSMHFWSFTPSPEQPGRLKGGGGGAETRAGRLRQFGVGTAELSGHEVSRRRPTQAARRFREFAARRGCEGRVFTASKLSETRTRVSDVG